MDVCISVTAAIVISSIPNFVAFGTFLLACAKPGCVVRELRWLAQQGKPCGVPGELVGVAIQALRTDCLVLPAVYR
jgi:hypothetical protein